MRLATLLVLAALLSASAAAQPLRVESIRADLAARDTVAQTIPVTIELAWDAWRDGDRWNAAWIAASFEREPGVWSDLRFRTDAASARASAPVEVAPAEVPGGYARGLAVHRAADGAGTLFVTVEAVWDVGVSYATIPPDGVPLRALGVELSHVAAGPFEVGEAVPDSLRQPNAFQGAEGGTFQIGSEDEIAVGDVPGALAYVVPEGEAYAGGDAAGPVPAAFPKGADAFYVMTYPITQGQYADFLSILPPRARAARDVTAYPTYAEKGGSIVCDADTCRAVHPDRAANFLAWADGTAWAAWAGLRPMTELEYEKAAAGTPADSARYADGALPDRVDTLDRRSAWGAADLRGGLWERVVSLGTAEGRAYRGTPGRGFLDELGMPFGFANPGLARSACPRERLPRRHRRVARLVGGRRPHLRRLRGELRQRRPGLPRRPRRALSPPLRPPAFAAPCSHAHAPALRNLPRNGVRGGPAGPGRRRNRQADLLAPPARRRRGAGHRRAHPNRGRDLRPGRPPPPRRVARP